MIEGNEDNDEAVDVRFRRNQAFLSLKEIGFLLLKDIGFRDRYLERGA